MEEQLKELKRVFDIKHWREEDETFWAWILENFTPKVIPLDKPVIQKKAEEYIIEGELMRKTVAHDETILYINEDDGQIVIAYPTDLDDFVQVGSYVKLTLEII